MKPSKQLQRIADTDERVAVYEFDSGNDMGAHWLHLEWPWVDADDCGCIHDSPVGEWLRELQLATKVKHWRNPSGYAE